MPLQSAAPGSNAIATPSVVSRSFETDRFYQPGLLDAPDPWLWEALGSGATRVKSLVALGGLRLRHAPRSTSSCRGRRSPASRSTTT